AILLGVCDKIVPGLVIGALAFGHLPSVFAPAGPMTSGLSNPEKAAVRARYAQGQATREELLASEMAAYHGPGTCTFYGTANSNQMLMEMMGLHLPGAAFVNPGTPMLARVYPNGNGDVNHFHAAGGMAFVVRELLAAGLAHEAVTTVAGPGLSLYRQEPFLDGETLVWREGRSTSLDASILRPVSDPFDHHGGICVLSGGLGRAAIKTPAAKLGDP